MKKMTNGINSLESTKEEKSSGFIKINAKKLLTTLKGNKITILGHDNIDVDATLSGILLSKLLDFFKIENEFCIFEEIKEDNENYEIIKELIGIDMREWQTKEEFTERNLFLVDHYETTHKGSVIGLIDHHLTQQQKNYNFMYVRNSCATAYLIYEIMKEVNYPISTQEAKMIIVSMMVDTTSFRSSKTIKQEVEQAKKIAEEYGLDYDFLEQYCLCLTPIDRLNVEEIISNGQKWYNYNGNKIGSSYLQLYGMPSETKIQEWIELLKAKLQETGSNMLVFIIFETKSNITYEYQITAEWVKTIVSSGILSRGKDIMPQIERRYLEAKKLEDQINSIVKSLIKEEKTIVTMESCTGGGLANQITNIEGASEVLKESYVSYCNEAKIKFGVPKEVIKKYTVYSAETAEAMAKAASNNAKSNIGVGITGQLGRIDPYNPGAKNNQVWYCIMAEDKKIACKLQLSAKEIRSEQKEVVLREISESLYNNLK